MTTNEAIDVGDLVRIVEGVDTGDDQDIIYAQDIQAVGRVESIDSLNTVFVAFPRGTFGFMANEVYLVDTDALHAEMEEMIAEEAAEVSPLPRPGDRVRITRERHVFLGQEGKIMRTDIQEEDGENSIGYWVEFPKDKGGVWYARTDFEVLPADAEQPAAAPTVDMDSTFDVTKLDNLKTSALAILIIAEQHGPYQVIAEQAREVLKFNELLKAEREYPPSTVALIATLQARIAELEAALTPFALAAQVARQRGTPELFTLVTTWDEEQILVSGNGDGENDFLAVHHLFAAHRARYGTDAADK